jgi:predicted enzyme related to lactoylglutathione lyase
MSANAIAWFEIYVQDMQRAKKFYESVFQRTLAELKSPAGDLEMWHFEGEMNSYGAAGALVKMAGMTPGNSGTIVYFACKDCAVEEKRAAQFGGSICKPKMSIGQYGFISLVNDTEGNMIGLHSM